jgi:hypothetical protein
MHREIAEEPDVLESPADPAPADLIRLAAGDVLIAELHVP